MSYNIDENIDKDFAQIDNLLDAPNISFDDKIRILAEINKNIDNYSKGIPILINKVKTALNDFYDNEEKKIIRNQLKKNPFIDMASKLAYQTIQTNNDYIIENIIDELFNECVNDLNEINEKKTKIKNKEILLNNLDLIRNNINLFKKNEDINIHNQIKKIEEKGIYDNKSLKIGNDGYLSDIPDSLKIKIKKFKAEPSKYMIERCEKIKEDFKNYMLLKGSFFSEYDIFKLYDEIVDSLTNNIINEGIENYINQLHDCVNKIYDKEINKINKINK